MDCKNDKRIYLRRSSMRDRSPCRWYKRLFDICICISGVVILAPVFLIIAMLIKIDSPKETVLFRQKRVGKDQKKFQMYKFRTMVEGAEDMLVDILSLNEVEGAMFKMENDPRVTRIGKFLRKTSLDEFPQLLNVIKGDMSLIGPRPPLVREVKEYTDDHKARLSIRPGCTGLWQVSGRNKLSFEEMVNLDLIYINNWSFRGDMKIFFKTFKVLFGQEGY